ncbi:acyltransferase family protein [Agromyces italicus]|uniref:acyltransferase family protein n=1 Tax=Agromyces italicus TaxID=279572 RepID=UPI0003B789AF|nr:acyltransferase family protein [Agromyces italicus]
MTLTTATAATETRTEQPIGPPIAYRHDLDGLRALAIALVVAYHVWFGRVSGGVDVFLMLSAFFLTGSFLRRLERGGRPGIPRYWARTFARLLPAVAVTLLGVLALTAIAIPASQWPSIWQQTWASLVYMQNWVLAATAVDYYAPRDALTSPLLHFWSLSIQGQVFVLWPLLIGTAWFIHRRTRFSLRAVMLTVFALVFAASFAFSIVETSANQGSAYFNTFTRLWEFALGSMLALLVPAIRLGPMIRSVLGWLGLAGIVSCGIVLDVAGGFPGYLALWPTLSAAAVILAGCGPVVRTSPYALLSSRPLRALGRNAYALYLVHWPLLIAAIAVRDGRAPGILVGTAVVGASLVIAWALTTFVERPIRRRAESPARAVLVIVLSFSLVAVPLPAWTAYATGEAERLVAEQGERYPGARVLLPGAEQVEPRKELLPAPTMLDREWVSLGEACENELLPAGALAGACGQSAGSGERLLVVVGDSHAEQFMGALVPVAEAQNWRLSSILKGGCGFGIDDATLSRECREWNERVLDHLIRLKPDAVFTVVTAAEPDGPGERLTPGVGAAIDQLDAAGIEVIGVRDHPRFAANKYTCALENLADPSVCEVSVEHALAAVNPAAALVSERLALVDLTPAICPEGTCRVVIGNTAVYLDNNHLTWTYARSMAPHLAAQLGVTTG